MPQQNCPICQVEVQPSSRYPRYLCVTCAESAASVDGRPLEFFNVSISGGFAGKYADNHEAYHSHECYVRGVRCHAREARFGGIVVQVDD